MRRVVSFSLMTFLFMLLVGTAQAQNVTGAWTLTYSQTGRDGQAMERTMDITLLQDGTVVTGTVTLAAMGGRGGGGGGGGGAPREIEIQDGTMEGNVLTFSLTMGMGERSMTQSFTATVTGNTMEGTMTGGMRQTGDVPFTGVKKEG